jgi:hypothetical protein
MGGTADNGRMRSRQEIRGIVGSYAKSGMTRREYCEKHNIPITTLDYWRRADKSKLKLVEIAEEPRTDHVLTTLTNVSLTNVSLSVAFVVVRFY